MNVRLSHLTAVAVMIALVGAMFASVGSVSAASFGTCTPDNVSTEDVVEQTTIAIGDDCTFAVGEGGKVSFDSANGTNVLMLSDDADDDGDNYVGGMLDGTTYTVGTSGDDGDDADLVTVKGVTAGTVTLTYDNDTPNVDTDDPVIRVVVVPEAQLTVTLSDTDNRVKAGTPVTVTAVLQGVDMGLAADQVVTLSVPSTGIYFTAADIDVDGEIDDTADSTEQFPNGAQRLVFDRTSFDLALNKAGAAFTATLSTEGAPDGEYVITAKVTKSETKVGTAPNDAVPARLARDISKSATLRIGDPGTPVDSATLELDAGQNAAIGAGKEIGLVVTAKNSLGAKSNNGEVLQVLVYAQGATIIHDGEGESSFLQIDPANAVTKFQVRKVAEGSVDVTATVISTGPAKTTETLSLAFTGSQSSVMVADGTKSLAAVSPSDDASTSDKDESMNDAIMLSVAASDKGGNSIAPYDSGWTITITGPDEKPVSTTNRITASQPMMVPGTTNSYAITLDGMGTARQPLAAGEYTLKAKRGELEDTASFTVAGATGNASLEVDHDSVSEFGQQVTATATLTDAEGNHVVDGTEVIFTVSGKGLTAAGKGVVGTNTTTKSSGGMAKATYVATGSGTAVIAVVADNTTAVATVTSTAGAEEPAEEAMGLSCLSTFNAFSTYTCAQDSSASELFALVSGRDATAIHLWNGAAWVRYSVVEGAMVPGSTDFPVGKNETLYISY